MNELKIISTTPGVIETNFAPFKKALTKALKDYKGLVVTEDNSKEMNSKRLELTKGKGIIKKERIAQKKEYMKGYEKYDAECKEATELIEVVETELKDKVDYFDEITRQAKRDYAVKTAMELAASLKLELEYQNRIDVEKDSYVLKGTKEKDILTDLTEQINTLEKLQKARYSNEQYVLNQLVTSSKLANLSTDLVIDDISHLINDYEQMDIVAVTNGINAVALRRKESEEAAVRREEARMKAEEAMREKIRLEEIAKKEAEVKAKIELETRMKIEAEQKAVRELEAKQLQAIKKLPEITNKDFTETEPFETFEPQKQVQFVSESNGFVSIEDCDTELEEDEIQDASMEDMFGNMFSEEMAVVRVTCKKSETIDIIRLLTLNGFDCGVE